MRKFWCAIFPLLSVSGNSELITPTVFFSSEACYVNTGHPDFLTGHRAMAIVAERVNANKAPPPQQIDPKTGRPMPTPPPANSASLMPNPSQTINQALIEGDANSGFFGSFFTKKKKPGVLEAVCYEKKGCIRSIWLSEFFNLVCF